MKILFCFCTLISLFNNLALSQESNVDTNFILRENGLYYHAIFIDSNKSSHFYSELENNTKSPFDSTFYFDGLVRLRKNKIKIKHQSINTIAQDWMPLYLYKGKYYNYYPSDGMYTNWIKISDSIFLTYAGGEMITSSITKLIKKSITEFQFTLTGETGSKENVNVIVIDSKNGVAIFEYPKRKFAKYELRITTNKIRKFPVIVNYCTEQKQEEFKFDIPNFLQLLKYSIASKLD